MVGLAAAGRDGGEGDAPVGGVGQEGGVVGFPYALAVGLDNRAILQLNGEEGGKHIGHDVAGAHIDPAVFVDFTAEELAAVGAFFAENFGAMAKGGIVEDERAAFTAGDVFSLMEAEGGHAAEGAELAGVISAEESVGIVFDDGKMMTGRGFEQAMHFTGNAGVVYRDDGPSAFVDEGLEQGFVEVESVRAYVDKAGACTAEDEGVGGGDEGVGGQDDFVSGLQVEKDGGHLESMGAGGGEQNAGGGLGEDLRQEGFGLPGEAAVAGDVAGVEGSAHGVEFGTAFEGAVEGDFG